MTKGIIIYSTKTCPFCKMAKQYFESKKIAYKDVDVSDDEKLAMEAVAKSGQYAVPVIDIGGTIVVGYNRPAIDVALAL